MALPMLEKILYVEDEDDIREVALLAIETIGGFQCITCNSGKEAVALAYTFKPQLILLDVMMPVMDGPATLQVLKQDPLLKDIPVVFLTAKIMTDEINRFKAMGVIDIIAKPFDPMLLAAQIQAIWDKYHA